MVYLPTFTRKWDWCRGKYLSAAGSFVEANAAKESRIPREQLGEVAEVNHTVGQYLVELEKQSPPEEPVHKQDRVSTTDPDSTYATKSGTPARLGYYDNYLVDNHYPRDTQTAARRRLEFRKSWGPRLSFRRFDSDRAFNCWSWQFMDYAQS
jgi:hypothetical protein